jgi:hypothetical protein
MTDLELMEHAREFAQLYGLTIDFDSPLGFGNDGTVWKTRDLTAVKAHRRERNYQLEVECYQRLLDVGVKELCGFTIPQLLRFDDQRWIIEIEIVTPPYLLDFGKVGLDVRPDYSPEVWNDWLDQRSELFEHRWPEVQSLLRALEYHGIYYLDPKPGNIMFEDWDPA